MASSVLLRRRPAAPTRLDSGFSCPTINAALVPEGGLPSACSAAILTTTPNAVTLALHDRMPVILDPDAYELWLDPEMRDAGAASKLLKPCNAQLMRCYPVSTRLNSVTNDDEECSAPVELAQIRSRLFS
jgi:putative SOS response-associated peptidase YedK